MVSIHAGHELLRAVLVQSVRALFKRVWRFWCLWTGLVPVLSVSTSTSFIGASKASVLNSSGRGRSGYAKDGAKAKTNLSSWNSLSNSYDQSNLHRFFIKIFVQDAVVFLNKRLNGRFSSSTSRNWRIL